LEAFSLTLRHEAANCGTSSGIPSREEAAFRPLKAAALFGVVLFIVADD
jgi:hypothetical protein